MKISQINIYQHELNVTGNAYEMSHSSINSFTSIITEVVTDNGMKGFGETCSVGPVYQQEHALGAVAALSELAPHLIGENPLLIESVNRKMNQTLYGHLYAKSTIDVALWDICGKFYNCRVCDLLGGAINEKVPSYYAIGPATPADTAEIAMDKIGQGYRRLQLKVGGRHVDQDIESCHRVAENITRDIKLVADANRGWTTQDTIRFSRACCDIPLVIEQPCNTFEEIESLKGKIYHPVFMDESVLDLNAVLRCINAGAADGFGFKLNRMGGLSAMRTIRDICRSRNLPHTCDDSWGGDIIAAACVHVGATVEPHLLEGVWIADSYHDHHYDEVNPVQVKNGFVDVPENPGLGVIPDVSIFGHPVFSV